ncbi:MAG: recombinase family protein, partial [Planctomycetota bacterium]
MRRTLANMASFYTEQQPVDVKDGLARRVKEGLFVGKAPYGYRNVRHNDRSLVEVDPEHGPKIERIFELYAFHGHTLDSLVAHLAETGVSYSESAPRFTRSKLHTILRDRAYIGEIAYHGEWYPGSHEPLVSRAVFDRVQALLGEQTYQSHDLVYGCERITCGHCGNAVTGEAKIKDTKKGPKQYVYYRCAKYNKNGHPRIRIREADLDQQVLAMFDQIRIQDDRVRDWFGRVLRARTQDQQRDGQERAAELSRQLTSQRNQQDRLLNLRLNDEIEEGTYAAKSRELRDRIAQLTLQLEACDRDRSEQADIASKAFELSQTLREKWLNADVRAKRRLLEIVCLNFSLDGASLVPAIGIGGSLAAPALPHHRAYGSVPRRFGWLNFHFGLVEQRKSQF